MNMRFLALVLICLSLVACTNQDVSLRPLSEKNLTSPDGKHAVVSVEETCDCTTGLYHSIYLQKTGQDKRESLYEGGPEDSVSANWL